MNSSVPVGRNSIIESPTSAFQRNLSQVRRRSRRPPPSYSSPPSLYELPPRDLPSSSALYDEPPGTMYQAAPSLYDEPPTLPLSEKFTKLSQELHSTEERYLGDLVLAKKLFYHNMAKVADKELLKAVFLNWDQLIDASRRMLARMKRSEPTGSMFMAEIDSMSVFVTFCQSQQAALEAIPALLAKPEVRTVYTQCCASPHARGMSLNYFLLLPLGRVTRYPLLLEKMLKECDSGYSDHQDLDAALQLLRALVAEVNRAVSEGKRTFSHSGVIWKARSGKMLVAVLFNDFLLLTTPDEAISEPERFRVSKTSDVFLNLYKRPYLVDSLRIEQGREECNFNLISGSEVVSLRCATRNAAKLWMTQLQTAIEQCQQTLHDGDSRRRSTVQENTKGRLLVEVMSLQYLSSNTAGSAPEKSVYRQYLKQNEFQHCARTSLGFSNESFDVDLSKPELRLTTQFPFTHTDHMFSFGLYQKRTYCPDVLILDEVKVSLKSLIAEFSSHRGPITKPMKLRTTGSGHSSRNTEIVMIKFVVQLFDSEL